MVSNFSSVNLVNRILFPSMMNFMRHLNILHFTALKLIPLSLIKKNIIPFIFREKKIIVKHLIERSLRYQYINNVQIVLPNLNRFLAAFCPFETHRGFNYVSDVELCRTSTNKIYYYTYIILTLYVWYSSLWWLVWIRTTNTPVYGRKYLNNTCVNLEIQIENVVPLWASLHLIRHFLPTFFSLSFRLVAMNKIRPHSALNVEHFIRILTYNHDSKHYYKDTQRTRTRIHFCQYLFFLLDQKRSPYLYSCNEFFTIAIAWRMSKRKK